MTRLTLVLALVATPAAAQEGARLPVFPMGTDPAPQNTIPERPGVTIRSQTERPRPGQGVGVTTREDWNGGPPPRSDSDGAGDVAASPPATAAEEAPVFSGLGSTTNQPDALVTDTEAAPALGENAPAEDTEVIETVVAPPAVTEPLVETDEVVALAPVTSFRPTARPIANAPEDAQVETVALEEAQEVTETPTTGAGAELPVMDLTDIISTAIDAESRDAARTETATASLGEVSGQVVETAAGAVLRGLDKVSGEVVDLDLSVGQTAQLGRISVSLGACRYPARNPSGDAYAWVEVEAEGQSDPAFQGWMVASSPALSALDHPRYDVWVIRCKSS